MNNRYTWEYRDANDKWIVYKEALTELEARSKFNFEKGLRKVDVKKWESIRDLVDKSIRSGQSKDDFCDEHNITRGEWYKLKPKNFKWQKIQKQLNIKVNKPRKAEELIVKPTTEPTVEVAEEYACNKKGCANVHDVDGVCPYCKINLLEKIMGIYREGFSDEHIREVLG